MSGYRVRYAVTFPRLVPSAIELEAKALHQYTELPDGRVLIDVQMTDADANAMLAEPGCMAFDDPSDVLVWQSNHPELFPEVEV